MKFISNKDLTNKNYVYKKQKVSILTISHKTKGAPCNYNC